MNDVIDRIAIAAEKNSRIFNNLLRGYCGKYGFGLLTLEEDRVELSLERIYELNQAIYAIGQLPPPRLSVDAINIILADYPHRLPIEFYDLYQRGNGFTPIGLGDKDWDCYYNYWMLPNIRDLCFSPLGEAMSFYKEMHNHRYTHGELDPKIFPLMSFERTIWAIAGSEIQQSNSPIFRFHMDDVSRDNSSVMETAWNSLTEMMSDLSRDDFEMEMAWNSL